MAEDDLTKSWIARDRVNPHPSAIWHQRGDLVFAIEANNVTNAGNPDGQSIPAWDDTMTKIIAYFRPGTAFTIIDVPRTRYIKVFSPIGPAWIQGHDVKP